MSNYPDLRTENSVLSMAPAPCLPRPKRTDSYSKTIPPSKEAFLKWMRLRPIRGDIERHEVQHCAPSGPRNPDLGWLLGIDELTGSRGGLRRR